MSTTQHRDDQTRVKAALALCAYKRSAAFCLMDYLTINEQEAFVSLILEPAYRRGADWHDLADFMYLVGLFSDRAYLFSSSEKAA